MLSHIILLIAFLFFIAEISSTSQFNLQSINYFDYNETKNILVGSVGGWSHIRPLIEICKILIDRGHNITLISPGNYSSPIIHHITSGPSFDIENIPEYQKIISEEYNIEMLGYLKNYLNSKYLNDFNLYKKVVNEMVKVDLFFCDLFLNDACIDIAWLMNKPLVTMSSKLSMSYAPYKSDPMIGCHVNMEQETFLKRFRCAIITPIQMNYVLSPYTKKLDELKKSVGISSNDFFEKLQNSLFLADTFFGFETSHPTPPLYQEIGPIMSDSYLPLTQKLYNFITLHRRIIYVSFGTQVYTTPKNNAILLQAFIEAINSNIIDGIIWSFLKSTSKELKELFPPTIVMSNNSTINTLNILNNHPSIHITEYSPQFSILNHTNIKIHLTHGGIGSIYESLYTGTPMLLLPIAFDQFGNSEKLLENDVGVFLSKVSLNVQDIISKIKILQTDKNILLNVERMRNLAMINCKRKFRAADLIDFVLYSNQLNSAQNCQEKENCVNEDLKVWITPEARMGFMRGKYLDIYISLLVGCLIIICMIIWIIWKFCKLMFRIFCCCLIF